MSDAPVSDAAKKLEADFHALKGGWADPETRQRCRQIAEAALSAAEARGRADMAREIAEMVKARARLIRAEAESLGISATRHRPMSPMLVEACVLEELAARIEAKR